MLFFSINKLRAYFFKADAVMASSNEWQSFQGWNFQNLKDKSVLQADITKLFYKNNTKL